MKFYLYTRIDILGYTKSHRDVANYCFFSPEIVDLKQVAAQQLATAPDSNPGPGDPGWDGRQKVGRSGKKGHFGCIFNIKSPSHLEWKKNWNSGNHWIFEFLLWLNQGHRSFLSSLGLDWLEAQTWSTPSIQNCQRMAWYKMATRPLVNKSYKPTPTPTSKKKTHISSKFTSLFCVVQAGKTTSQNSSHQPFIQDAHEKPLRCGKSCPSFRLASKRPAPLLTAKAKAWMAKFPNHRAYQKTCLQNPIENVYHVVFEL